jgi:hypothetical protein
LNSLRDFRHFVTSLAWVAGCHEMALAVSFGAAPVAAVRPITTGAMNDERLAARHAGAASLRADTRRII